MAICTEDGCKFDIDGKCIDGFSPASSCPHYRETEAESSAPSSDDLPEFESEAEQIYTPAIPESFHQLYSGEALTAVQCRSITSRSLTKLVLLAGLASSGKTTATATLFDLFQIGPFADYFFAGSQTLIASEQRSHDSKIASNRNKEVTVRTLLTTPTFLHLRVKKQAGGQFIDLLLTDISGEFFKLLKTSTVECKKFILAQRADHFALFLDAAALSDNERRQEAKSGSIGVLRSLIDAKVISPCCRVQIVFSKSDLAVESMNEGEGANPFFENIKREVREKWKGMTITFHHIASRPPAGSSLDFGYGLDGLLEIWTEYSQFTEKSRATEVGAPISSDREFLKYSVPEKK